MIPVGITMLFPGNLGDSRGSSHSRSRSSSRSRSRENTASCLCLEPISILNRLVQRNRFYTYRIFTNLTEKVQI